ncbi:cytochrome c oxidase subunit 6B1-like isoform X4 [Cimex lectularius]|nr:cytochrome c oxidase subunit 6B1-like isoform X4 [Cimex lectularius]
MPPMAVMASKTETKQELQTAPYDPRFPNQNQSKHCFQNYMEFHRCRKVKGEGYDPCNYFKRVYLSLCPNSWVEKWDSQIEEGIFPRKI